MSEPSTPLPLVQPSPYSLASSFTPVPPNQPPALTQPRYRIIRGATDEDTDEYVLDPDGDFP